MHYRLMLSGTLCATLLFGTVQAQEQGKEQADAMMKKWKEISTPGDAHKKLDAFLGNWNVEIRAWMGGPAVPPQSSKGTSTYAWTVGGRYLRQDFRGEMAGMSMEGQGFTGYDNYEKKYVGVWMDNSSTAIYSLEGTMNPDGTLLTMYGKMDEWMTGEIGKMAKYVFRILGKDKIVFEIHDLSIGEPNTKVVEMTMTRAK
jgi:hypothetical protein